MARGRGRAAAPGLLAHEIGHNLALDHVDGDPRFGGANVMQSAHATGRSRQFPTEGQAYRAHIRSISAIARWEVYELGPTPAAREELDSTLSDRWRLRQDWIKTNGAEAIGVELAEQLLAQSEEDFRLEEDAKLVQRGATPPSPASVVIPPAAARPALRAA